MYLTSEEKLWHEYLMVINEMSENPGLYHLDTMRKELHDKLKVYYRNLHEDFIEERFDKICHNMDKIFRFKPPIDKYDNLKVYAREISHRMWTDLRLYVVGHNSIIEKEHKLT